MGNNKQYELADNKITIVNGLDVEEAEECDNENQLNDKETILSHSNAMTIF